MRRVALSILIALSMGQALTGCAASYGARARMSAPADLAPEEQTTWARPQEVGFDIGDEIRGEATHVSILFGLLRFGADDGSTAFGWVGGVVGDVLNFKPLSYLPTDPLTRAAAGNAVHNTQGADGIYITSQEVNTFDLFLFEKRTAKVRGRMLKMRAIGEVSQERADKNRNLRALGRPELEVPATLGELVD